MWRVEHGDCLDVMRGMPDNSVDAVVTDPPYGLSFMGKRWDYDVPAVEVWAECLRLLKPGGHLLAFAGTRTQHRMAVRIEDAGFEIRDIIAWVYGSGFPKSHNLDGDWKGWGTALKPALEPITVARKPLAGTVAENVLAHGTGGLNIDGCRIPFLDTNDKEAAAAAQRACQDQNKNRTAYGDFHNGPASLEPYLRSMAAGRWPANLMHDGSEEVTGLLGDAARFFYCPKASKADRDEGCGGMEEREAADYDHRPSGDFAERMNRQRPDVVRRNHHPTVKPADLMRYLCRLVTPPGGIVLDPFTGSGSTGKAAVLEGFEFIGIEREAEYVALARARIATKIDRQRTLFS